MERRMDCKKEQIGGKSTEAQFGQKLFKCQEPKAEQRRCEIGFDFGDERMCWENGGDAAISVRTPHAVESTKKAVGNEGYGVQA